MAKFIKVCVEKVKKPDVSRVLPISKWFKSTEEELFLCAWRCFVLLMTPCAGLRSKIPRRTWVRGSTVYWLRALIGWFDIKRVFWLPEYFFYLWKSKGRAVIPPVRPGFKYRRRRHMWVFLLVFSFAQSSHLASSSIMDMRGERSESRENARSHGRGKGELSLSFSAPRTRVSFLVVLSWTSRDFSKCRACSERFFSGVLKVFPSPQKPTLPNSNSTRNDRRRTTLWMCYL